MRRKHVSKYQIQMNKRIKFKMIIKMKNKSNKKRSTKKVRIANKIMRIKMISNFKN